jgi:hypothetical protein
MNKKSRFYGLYRILDDPKNLILGTLIIGLIFLFGGALSLKYYFNGPIPEKAMAVCAAISLLWFLSSSILTIKYRELPRTGGLPSFHGGFAVIVGIILLTFIIVGEVYLIIIIIN